MQNLPPPLKDKANNVYEVSAKPQLIRYYHAAAGFPTKPTWLAAIKNGHCSSWPGLTAEDAAKYFPESDEMWKGHGRKIKAGLRSTKQLVQTEENETTEMEIPEEKAIFVKEYDLANELDRKMYTDQTGKFPVTSYKGNQYIMVLFETSSNIILVEAMRSRTSGEMVRAYQVLVDRLKVCNISPTRHILDNECSAELKEAIVDNEMTFQLVPPHDHRRNVAEKAIQTFKDHFVAVLCGTDESFPLQLWCQILRQAEHQLNMLRKSRANPSISAFEQMNGPHNFDANPFAILGCAVEMHVMPKNRRTWEAHTKTGFYLGTSWDHYRCHEVWIKDTRSPRIGQTVFFKHKYITQPPITTSDALLRASEDICEALRKTAPNNKNTRTAIDLLIDIFKGQAKSEETPTDNHRARMNKAQDQRTEVGNISDDATIKMSNTESTQSQRVNGEAQRVGPDTTKIRRWIREDPSSKAFLTTKKGGPDWTKVKRRVTIEIRSGEVIEDLLVEDKITDAHLHRKLPTNVSGTVTILYHNDATIKNDEQPHSIEKPTDSDFQLEDDDGDLQIPGITVTYPSANEPTPNLISQDEMGPSQNTRAAVRNRLLSAIEISGTVPSPRQLASRKFSTQFLTDYANAVMDNETGELLEYRHLIKRPKYKVPWKYSFGNEVGRLAQGMPGRTTGTNTIFFIHKSEIPAERWKDVTSGRIVCDERPQKAEVNRTRLTIDGSRINIDIDCGTPTASLLTVKLLLNSVLSTPGAKFMCLDLKDFYLNTPLARPEFLRLRLANFPEDVIEHYGLREKVDAKGYIYVKCVRGMYGLPHAGIIAQELLEKRLEKHGYYQSKTTPGFWSHKWRPISFSLIVDDFGVKYVGEEHAQHLINVLKEHYELTEDWEGKKYSGITLDWDYVRRQVHLSMPGYCKEALVRFNHILRKLNNQPHKHNEPKYGAKVQYAE